MATIEPADLRPTQEEVARILGISARRIRELMQRGDLPAAGATLAELVQSFVELKKRPRRRGASKSA